MDFPSSARAAEERTTWKGVVVKSTVVPPTTLQGNGID